VHLQNEKLEFINNVVGTDDGALAHVKRAKRGKGIDRRIFNYGEDEGDDEDVANEDNDADKYEGSEEDDGKI
jgi:hypothetical protein